MLRRVSSLLQATVTQTAEIALSVAVAKGNDSQDEHIEISVDGTPIPFEEVESYDGTRLHLVPEVPPGQLKVDYAADVYGQGDPAEVSTMDRLVYLRPSRYCDSDRMAPVSRRWFKGLDGVELVTAVRDWVNTELFYVSGSSRHTDGAVDTYLARQGVCRDFAHLVIALLRARDVPARLVSVYAPDLRPMDFHAVAEVAIDGVWHLLDATGLAPRESMVRIATGRDAADTAFMCIHSGRLRLGYMQVNASVTPDMAPEDPTRLLWLR